MTQTIAESTAVDFFDDKAHRETADAYAWNDGEQTYILRVGQAVVSSAEGPPQTVSMAEFVGGVAYALYTRGDITESDLELIPDLSDAMDSELIHRVAIHDSRNTCLPH